MTAPVTTVGRVGAAFVHPFASETADDAGADLRLSQLWSSRVQQHGGVRFVARAPRAAAADVVAAATADGRHRGEHIHLANAYSIAVADTTAAVADVFGSARAWLLPDGRPLTWISALRRDSPRLRQVRGPQFMLDVAEIGRERNLRHYLLGGTPEVLDQLQQNLERRFPGIAIVGADSPPFRPPTPFDLERRDAAIRESGAQVVWVGLGTPKQDLEAKRLAESLPVVALAVGAAFDYAAGTLSPAPLWVSQIGMEWFWRLLAEPRRLWKRYTIGNAQFIRALLRSRRVERPAAGERSRATGTTVVVGQLPPPMHGSAAMTVRLIDALTAGGHLVDVVDRRFSRTVQEVGRPGLRKLVAVPSLVGRFVAAARRSDRVVLLITSTPGSFLIDSLLLMLTRRPVVLYVHTVGYRALSSRGRMWEALVRRAFARADEVVVLGPTLRGDVAAFVADDRLHVIPNSTPAGAIVPRTSGARLLFLANLLPGKGADVFVRLAHALVEQHPDTPWHFELAGAGDASALGPLPTGLTVHGRVDGEAKAALLQDADVLVVPSTYAMEAQPLVIVEALAHGLPVVAYDTGGIRDLVDDGVGRIVPAGDEQALAVAVMDLLSDPAQLVRIGEAATARFLLRHSPAAYIAAWQSLLARPLQAAKRAGVAAARSGTGIAQAPASISGHRSAGKLPVDA